MWAHSLMLEYGLWNVDQMPKSIGQIPSVMFYAFYHHHHTKEDDWMAEILSYGTKAGAFANAVSHWESFSLFTLEYPIPGIFAKLFVLLNLFYYPAAVAPFFLGYEIGVILLPVSHDWVHERKAASFGIYYLIRPLETIGLFATRADHRNHHDHTCRTVYQGFTSSGLYSARFDKILDDFWNYTFDKCVEMKYPLHKVLWYVMVGILCGTLCVFTSVLKIF